MNGDDKVFVTLIVMTAAVILASVVSAAVVDSTPESLCARACGSTRVERVTARECACRGAAR
jgi:hypothetical protein